MRVLFLLSLTAGLLLSMSGWAQDVPYDPAKPNVTGHELPKEFENVGVDEHLGGLLKTN